MTKPWCNSWAKSKHCPMTKAKPKPKAMPRLGHLGKPKPIA